MSSTVGDWNQLLADKVVFLTGAGGQIAKYIAKTCYAQGARLVLGDLEISLINDLTNQLTTNDDEKNDRILAVKLNITDETTIEQAMKAAVDKWGTIHVLINLAAYFQYGNVEDVSAESWSRVLDTNVRGLALMVKHIAPILKKQNSGSIINFASALGIVASPNTCPYAATKAAIIQLTRNFALDFGAFNIRVNSISPSLVDGPTVQANAEKMGLDAKKLKEVIASTSCLKRLSQPQEIANLCVFLCTDLCSSMTGANLVVDCGRTII